MPSAHCASPTCINYNHDFNLDHNLSLSPSSRVNPLRKQLQCPLPPNAIRPGNEYFARPVHPPCLPEPNPEDDQRDRRVYPDNNRNRINEPDHDHPVNTCSHRGRQTPEQQCFQTAKQPRTEQCPARMASRADHVPIDVVIPLDEVSAAPFEKAWLAHRSRAGGNRSFSRGADQDWPPTKCATWASPGGSNLVRNRQARLHTSCRRRLRRHELPPLCGFANFPYRITGLTFPSVGRHTQCTSIPARDK